MIMALHYQQLEITRVLVNHGAYLGHIDGEGKSAAHVLLSWHRHYNWHRHYSTDWQAHKFNNLLDSLKYLAESDFAHFGTPCLNGETPFHLAASCGIPYDAFHAIIRLSKRNITTEHYQELLSDAILGGERRIINHVLTASGQCISRSGMHQEVLLHDAIERNDRSEVERLLSQGVDANTPQAQGYTPLHKAVIFGSDISIINALLKFHANVNAQDVRGNTPLHHAVAPAGTDLSMPILRALFRGGANPHIRGEIGYWVSRPPFFNDPYFQFWTVRATATDCVRVSKDEQRIRDYFTVMRKFYPEAKLDDGDIFWDARETPEQSSGREGSSYEWCRVYNDASLRKWRNRRDDLRAGALQAWQGEWTLQPHPEKTNLGADQFPTILIYLGLQHEVEKAHEHQREADYFNLKVPDPTRPWMTKEEAKALSQPLRLTCSTGSDWKDYLRLEPPGNHQAGRCKALWRFWGALAGNTKNDATYGRG